MWKIYLGRNKELFDAELYVIGESLSITKRVRRMRQKGASQSATTQWIKIHIWVDSQSAIKQLQYIPLRPGQCLERCIKARTQQLVEQGVAVESHSVSGQMDIEGNEKADEAAKAVAETSST